MNLQTRLESSCLSEALDLFLTLGGLEGKTLATLAWYRYVMGGLTRSIGDVPVEQIAPETIRAYLLRRRAKVSEASFAGDVRGLGAFFRFLHREGVIAENPMARIPYPRLPEAFPRAYTPEQVGKLLRAFDRRSLYGHRAYVQFILILDTGLRSGECCRLRLGDVDLAARTLTVTGKGRKTRAVPFSPAAGALLRRWIGRLGISEPRQWLFPSRKWNGYAPIRPNSFGQAVRRAARRAGVDVPAAVHTIRHTFATNWCLAGGDALSLQQVLGHEKLETVTVYTRMTPEQLRMRHDALRPLRQVMR